MSSSRSAAPLKRSVVQSSHTSGFTTGVYLAATTPSRCCGDKVRLGYSLLRMSFTFLVFTLTENGRVGALVASIGQQRRQRRPQRTRSDSE